MATQFSQRFMAVAGLAVVATFSALLGHNDLWEQIDGPALGFAGLCIIGSIWLTLKEKRLGNLVLAGIAIAAYLAWLLPGMFFPDEVVYVDNTTSHRLQITLDGTNWLNVEPSTYKRKNLRRGTYRVAVFGENGAEMQNLDITIESRGFGEQDKVYILNLLGAGHYNIGQVTYGGNLGVQPLERQIDNPWFSTEAFWVFDNAPPAFLEMKKGQTITHGYISRRGG
jgi:hypothetical protein